MKGMMRRGQREDARELTRLSFASKGYWEYPEEWFQIWEKELTLTPEYMEENPVWVVEEPEAPDPILGYYSLVDLKEDIFISGIRLPAGTWLEHMFIRPDVIGHGLGRRLFDHCKAQCRHREIPCLDILADPNAREFYEKMGAAFIKEYPSTIEGRTTPWLRYTM